MQHYLTREGLEKLKQELEHLKNVSRKEVVARIAAAKELGDLKENAEYAEAKDDQGLLEGRIAELEATVKNAVLISEHSTNAVGIGSTVKILCNGKEMHYTIVGPEEANPAEARISFESPFGRSLLNKKKGDKVMVAVPKGDLECEVMEIK